MTIVLSKHGRTFATRLRARVVLAEELASSSTASITIDARDVFMSPGFIAEALVILIKERGFERVVVQGAREHPAEVAKNLAEKFGYADRVEVEQPLPST